MGCAAPSEFAAAFRHFRCRARHAPTLTELPRKTSTFETNAGQVAAGRKDWKSSEKHSCAQLAFDFPNIASRLKILHPNRRRLIRVADSAYDLKSESHRGWTLAQAFARCASPNLVVERTRARNALQAATVPGRRILARRGEDGLLYGNPIAHRFRNCEINSRAAGWAVRADVISKLEIGSLAAVARPSLHAPAVPIPASAWRSLTKVNLRKSEASEAKSDTHKIFDVRVFPAIESPNASELIENLSLKDVFRRFIASDPQFSRRKELTTERGGSLVEPGYLYPGNSRFMPVRFAEEDLWNSPIGCLNVPTAADRAANLAKATLQRRFRRLLDLLRSGAVTARGLDSSGKTTEILPSIWQRPGTLINLETGDLHEIDSQAEDEETMISAPIFRAVMIGGTPASPAATAIPMEAKQTIKGRKRVESTTTAEAECQEWLCELMRSSPDRKIKTKSYWKSEALRRWRDKLSGEGFLRAWANALKATKALAWGAAGAPRRQSLR